MRSRVAVLVAVLAAAASEARAQDVRLRLEAPEKVLRPGRKSFLRFAVENAGKAEAKLEEPESYLEGLEIADPDGRVVKAVGKTRGISRRSITLEAGGFFGRTVDVGPALEVPEDKEGWYRFKWAFGDAVSNEVRVYVMRDWIAAIETNHGTITLELYPDLAPNHVRNFLSLSRSGFYEGSLFHRVIPGFMMQGGAPKEPGREPKPLQAEFSETKHVFGTVSMARTQDPNSATSQFYICFGAVPHLDRNYTVFGQVIGGEEVVKAVERVKSDHSPCKGCGRPADRPGATPCCGRHHQDKPEQDVVIKKIVVTERKPKDP
jgi:cyclophilin family peptidyl-prolyl cis-trans isomerase